MKDFLQFIRQQGVFGLAIGFILGSSVSKVVTSLVNDIINPVLGVVVGSTKGLEKAALQFGQTKILYGHFISVLIDFLIIATIVYVLVKLLKVEIAGKKK